MKTKTVFKISILACLAVSFLSAATVPVYVESSTGSVVSPSAFNPLSDGDPLEWGDVTGTPTTLTGYGITDAATAAQGALADTATQPADFDTFAELDALVADQTLLNTATGYTQTAADAAFQPLGAVTPVNAQDYDGQRMHRLPVLLAPAPTHANLIHYYPLNSLTDEGSGGIDLTVATGALKHSLTSNGYGVDNTDGALQLTAAITDIDWSASWTVWLRVIPVDVTDSGAFFLVGDADPTRVFILRYQAGQFAVWWTSTGSLSYTTMESTGGGQKYGVNVEHTLQLVHDSVASTLTLTINGNEVVSATSVTVHNDASNVLNVGFASFPCALDELYIFDEAISDLSATVPSIWAEGRGHSMDFDLSRIDGTMGSHDDEVILLFGQSNLLWNNADFTNVSDFHYPEFGAAMAYYENGGEETDLIPVGPWPRAISDSAGSTISGASSGVEVGYAQALLERGFVNPTFLRYCIGGTGLAAGSSPSEGDWSASGTMWTGALAWVDARIAAHSLTAPTRLVWFQGEQDGLTQSYADAYEVNLLALIARARTAWGAGLPVTLCLPWDQNEDRPYLETVRSAMRSIASSDDKVDAIETKYLRRRDDVHLSAQGHEALGRACSTFHAFPRLF